MNKKDKLKEWFLEIGNKSPLVHRMIDYDDYLKIMTNFLLGKSNDYLNLYLIPEDGEYYISDSNNIYATLDDYYSISEESMKKAGEIAGVTFDDFRYYIDTSVNTFEKDLARFKEIIEILIKSKK
ncbi:MAG: hypothetical protein K5694_03260 [Bacilli bacterium]|nr:hypothetical protein [Bacilli bacterium]